MCRASTLISAKLSQSLLVDDHQELFFRHLCLRSMKKDIKQTIGNIMNRFVRFPISLSYRYKPSVDVPLKTKSFASPSHTSMKELRNRLEYRSKLLFNYFPELYNEYSESITHALNYSHSANLTVTHDDFLETDEYNARHMKIPQVKTEYSFQFKKKTKFPKWKSIWNGYSKDSSKHKVLDLISTIKSPINSRRRRRTQPKSYVAFNYILLKNLLISLSPQLRHSIIFKTNYSQFKQTIKFEHCSSDLIGYLIYDLKRRTTIDYDAFFDLLDYLIEESKIFYGNYKSLTKDIIPNCSAVNYLFMFCQSLDHLKTFLTKYAFIIRTQTQTCRLKLLIDCLKHSVDLRIINQLICLRIINIDTIKQQKKSNEHKLVTIAYYIAYYAFQNGYDPMSHNYLIEFTNLIIDICNSECPDPNYVLKETKEPERRNFSDWNSVVVYETGYPVYPSFPTDLLLKLKKFNHVSLFKRMVKEAFNEIPFPQRKPANEDYYYDRFAENPMLKAFFGQYYKYCNDPPKCDEDDIPLDEFVGFERYKFGKLCNLRRRK